MSPIQNPDLRRALAERIRYYNELGIYDFYQRERPAAESTVAVETEQREEMSPRKSAVAVSTSENLTVLTAKPEQSVSDPIAALKLIREDLGDCTRCKLHQQGRKQIVFGVGNPHAQARRS